MAKQLQITVICNVLRIILNIWGKLFEKPCSEFFMLAKRKKKSKPFILRDVQQ